MGRGGMREMMRGMMGGVVPEGVVPEDLPEPESRGARLLVRYCQPCHALPSPRMHAAEEWPAILARMTARMRHMEGMGMMMMDRVRAPTPEEESALLEYLETFALRPIPADALSEATGAGAVTFARVCSRCHAPPDPSLHAPEEWPAVVARMEGHEVPMGRPPITESERQEIIEFLRARSSSQP